VKVSEIKRLVKTLDLFSLKKAEEDLLNEQPLIIKINGIDDGEKLTHVMGAIYILAKMDSENMGFTMALRDYTQKVRTSLS
jgi:hypothetical protein